MTGNEGIAAPDRLGRVLVTGGRGMLAQAILRRAGGREVLALGRAELDLTRPSSAARMAALRPALIINCAAFTDVDAAEDAPEEARAINTWGARHCAQAAESCGARLVQVSTDFVFDGAKGEPYVEADATSPLNVYGLTKRDGEVEARALCGRAYVVRTAWLFGLGAANMVTRILDLAARHEELSFVCNQVGSPTFCDDLADGILALAGTAPPGTYHLAGEGHVARDAFARRILELCGVDDVPVEGVEAFPSRARRPTFAPLANREAARLGVVLPPWEDALRRYLAAAGLGALPTSPDALPAA